MKVTGAIAVAMLANLFTVPALAQADMQPPMNSFDYNYYTCDNGGAFMITYDSDKPTAATMTTSDNNKSYVMKRTPVDSGVQFTGGPVTFWTDGKTVRVQGTATTLSNCKVKSG